GPAFLANGFQEVALNGPIKRASGARKALYGGNGDMQDGLFVPIVLPASIRRYGVVPHLVANDSNQGSIGHSVGETNTQRRQVVPAEYLQAFHHPQDHSGCVAVAPRGVVPARPIENLLRLDARYRSS